jgi:F0F1-type ATP synthase assembly protein I
VARLSKEKTKLARQVGILTVIPFVLLSGPAIGYLLGSWLDGRFGTEPALLILFLLLGFVASGRETYRLIKLAGRENS